MLKHSRVIAVMIAVALVAAGCSQGLIQRGQRLVDEGNHQQAIDLFYQEIAKNPDSYVAWRELGIAFYKQGDLLKAEDALQQAATIQPDARTSLHLGLINEKHENYDEALASYRAALALNPSGKSREYIEAHLDQLIAKKVEAEVARALSSEAEIDVASIPENTVAVADFNAENLPSDLKPLARGLAEFTASDLAKVKSLTVVDRLKLDVIQKELDLSRQGLVDQSTAPRIGKLLGSRRLVTASVMDVDEQNLRLDGVIVNTVDSTTDVTDPAQGQLQKLFQLQKEFVFQILNDMGVQLTADERDAIQEVPTESYLALLAYSRGLEHQRAGRLGEAQREFSAAAQQDPGFGAAKARAQSVGASMSMGGSDGAHTTGQFEAAISQFAGSPVSTEGLERRLAGSVRGVIDPADVIKPENPPTSPPVIPRGTATVTIEGNTDAK